ncbi:hypothetical protein [Clostridium tetani]|nr:hypothetical protein [Clostridium tetani]
MSVYFDVSKTRFKLVVSEVYANVDSIDKDKKILKNIKKEDI